MSQPRPSNNAYLNYSRHSRAILNGLRTLITFGVEEVKISQALQFNIQEILKMDRVLVSEAMEMGGVNRIMEILATLGYADNSVQFQSTTPPKIEEFSIRCTLESMSEKAYLIRVPKREEPVWIPKIICRFEELDNENGYIIHMSRGIAVNKGLTSF